MADDKTPDPSANFQELLAQWERGFDAFATQIMGTENFSKSMNQVQNARLGAQQAFREFMGANLSSANMPTREDVLRVAEAVHAMDKRIARIESLLAELSSAVTVDRPAASGPPRTRKPPSASQPDSDGGTINE